VTSRPGPWPLTGRDAELARLAVAVRGEGGGGVVIAGDAGTGRSRLLDEAARLSGGTDRPAVRLAASRAASAIPFGTLAPLLGEGDGHPVARLRRAVDVLGGAVVAVDDAHLLDDASAVVLHQAVVGRRVLLVATVRDGAPPPDPVSALWKDGLVERLDVPALPDADIARLAGFALGGILDPALVRAFAGLAGGSPLVLRELVAEALASGSVRRDGDVWSLAGVLAPGPRLGELLLPDLDGLTAAEWEVVEVVAAGDVVPVAALDRLVSAPAVADLSRRRLLTVRTAGRRREVTFVRPALAELVRRTMPADRRREIDRAVFALGGDRRREDHLRIARRRLELSEEVEDPLEAARQAYLADDLDAARRFAALAPGPEAGVLLGQLLDESGLHEEAEELLGGMVPGGLVVPWALARSDNLFFGLGRLDEAVAVLAGPARRRRAEAFPLVVNGAWLRLHAGDPSAALAAVSSYGDDADPEHRVGAAIVAASALAALGRTGEAGEAAAAADRSPAEAPFPFVSRHRDFPRLVRVEALAAAGRFGQARRVVEEGYGVSVVSGPSFLRARWAWAAGTVALGEGRPDLAARRFREGAALQRRLRQPILLLADLAGLALAEAVRGDADAALDALGEADGLAVDGGLFAPDLARARGWVAVLAGDRGRAEAHLRTAVDVARSRSLWTAAAGALSDVGRLLDPAAAAAGLAEVAARTDSPLVGLLARLARGRSEGDTGTLAAVSHELETAGAVLLAAEAAAESSRLVGGRRADDLRLRALRLAERCEGARTPALLALGRSVPLTGREREVAALAAGGLPSREIAGRLGISVRTVDNLLQRTYRKLGVSGRAELGDAVAP